MWARTVGTCQHAIGGCPEGIAIAPNPVRESLPFQMSAPIMRGTGAGTVGGSQTAYESLVARVEQPGRHLGNRRAALERRPTHFRLRVAPLTFPNVNEIAQPQLCRQILVRV
jgi:hypothetical protein